MPYTLDIHLAPRASRDEIRGLHGQAVKIRLRAPPVDGKANQALLKFLAAVLAVPAGSLELVGGQTSRDKRVRIASLPAAEVWRRLGLPPPA